MKRILVPCDFSPPAINAFQFALNIAIKSGGEIYMIYVVELPVLHDTTLMPVLSIEQGYMNDLKEKTEKKFNDLVKSYDRKAVMITTEVVFGVVTTMIIDYAKAKDIDVIVIGSHGASGAREFFVGSNAEKIVRKSSVPVFVVKTLYSSDIKRIVLPYTFETDDQQDFIARVITLQKFFQAQLHIVWINTPGAFYRDLHTLKRMDTFAKRYGLQNFEIHTFSDVNERDGIINFTDTINGDLIAMGTHGGQRIAYLLSQTVTEGVVNHVKWPIWTYLVK